MIFMYEYGSPLKLIQALRPGQVRRSLTQFPVSRPLLLIFIIMLLMKSSLQEEYCELSRSTPWMSNDKTLNTSYTVQSFIKSSTTDLAEDVCLPQTSNLTITCNKELCSSVCNSSIVERTQVARNQSLSFCDSYKLHDVLENEACLVNSYLDCSECTAKIEELDELARLLFETYQSVLDRFDCVRSNFSVNWRCDQCQTVYKNWVCSMVIPVYVNGTLERPCIEFCEEVERQCPYFLPDTSTQYGGHPSFICKDYSISSWDHPVINVNQVYGGEDTCHKTGLEVPENSTSTSTAAGLNHHTLVNGKLFVLYCVLHTFVYSHFVLLT